MFTDCPACHRQFHVYAAQLTAARGMVKCGFCGQKFNALERLRDKPLAQPDPGPPVSSEIESPSEPDFIIPEQEDEQMEREIPAAEELGPVPEQAAVKIAPRPVRSGKPAAPAAVTRSNGFRYTEALLWG